MSGAAGAGAGGGGGAHAGPVAVAPVVPVVPAGPVAPAHVVASATKARERDLYCAKKISGLGQIEPHDSHGNVKPLVWAPQLDYGAVGRLVQARSVETKMWQTMDVQIEDTKHLLKQLPDVRDLPKWMFEYVKSWEDVYKDAVKRHYDIGQPVLTAMYEAMFEIRRKVQHPALDEKMILTKILEWKRASGIDDTFCLDEDEMTLRFLFRNKHSSKHMCYIAGAILQKNEVCGKPGSYAATRMRHDLTTKIDLCIQQIRKDADEYEPADWLLEMQAELQAPVAVLITEKDYYFIDHTKVH